MYRVLLNRLNVGVIHSYMCNCLYNRHHVSFFQFTSSPSNNIFANLIQQRFKQTIISAKNGGVTEARKRVLAQLPISAQSYTRYSVVIERVFFKCHISSYEAVPRMEAWLKRERGFWHRCQSVHSHILGTVW